MYEASLYKDNCFLTLTFDDKNLNPKGSLVKSDFQKFMKRLRKKFPEPRIKFYHCGEYGEKFSRPHHHACLFNFNFPDRTIFKQKNGNNLYRSKILEDLWPFGYATIGDVTFDSAAYVAGYIQKKINGAMAPDHYQGRVPEYNTMSRGGRNGRGLSYDWFQKYKDSDIELAYRTGSIVMNGRTYKIPKYFDTLFEAENSNEFSAIKEERMEKAKNNPDNSPERLKAREAVHRARRSQKTREFESH